MTLDSKRDKSDVPRPDKHSLNCIALKLIHSRERIDTIAV